MNHQTLGAIMLPNTPREESFPDLSMPPVSHFIGTGVVQLKEILELPIVRTALQELTEGLPEGLYYHTIDHTKKVLETAYELAVVDNLPPRDIQLLVIAAAYHDWGYLIRRHDNEILGAGRVAESMRDDGRFTEQEIEDVCQAILDTKLEKNQDGIMVQIPRSRLSPYLLDADLNGFGKKGFLIDSFNVLREMTAITVADVDTMLSEEVVSFLKNTQQMVATHSYLTQAARSILGPQKQANELKLAALIKVLENPDRSQIGSMLPMM